MCVWQIPKWPNFHWDNLKLKRAEQIFAESVGVIVGASRHLSEGEHMALLVEVMSVEALGTSEIEGEYLRRETVQASIRRELGLEADNRRATPTEKGIAEMMVLLYHTRPEPLTEHMLFTWHKMLLQHSTRIESVGSYRTFTEAMQIVSGPDYSRKIHFEAPPSKQVPAEMKVFFSWLAEETKAKTLSPLTCAGIAHLWFESIHPFEDGNGRLGRAIAEKVLNQEAKMPIITALAKVLLRRRKEYYAALGEASRTLDITHWLLFFAAAVIEAQKTTLSYIDFIINKTKLYDHIGNNLNLRQEKVLARMFREGPEGFEGGLSAANYRSITGATTATITRDLLDLVAKGVLTRRGERKATRYYLAIQLSQVEHVNIEDVL